MSARDMNVDHRHIFILQCLLIVVDELISMISGATVLFMLASRSSPIFFVFTYLCVIRLLENSSRS